MKKSWMLFLFGAFLVGSLATSAQAQNTVVYGAEYNQSTNLFGTINLVNGNFTRISSLGKVLINDIAYCPTNGMLYGISNSTALVTFNETNGTMTKAASLSVSGIQSLAFRPGDGALFGASQSALYTINPTTGKATSVGNYGSPTNLNNKGQNIRFAQDGNLYMSNTSTNTDIYRINTTNGAATWMGEAVGYPYLMLENASSNMYSAFINLGSATNQTPKLVYFDLTSFVVGGTNANGSKHQITINLVGAGTNFPANFNFSGNIPQAITNLTVPVSATGPSNQTAVAGGNVVFSTVASGTGPYNYVWLKNGTAISGQTNSSLTLNSVTANDTATYSVIVGGAIGTVTNSATLTVNKATVSITLGSLNQTYDGMAEVATATTVPSGLAVVFTYNGSTTAPANAGSYTVVGTISDSNYQGSATSTLVINPAALTITAAANIKTYDGTTSAAAVPMVIGLQGFDTVTALVETYDTKNVGAGKNLSVSAYTVNDGNAGANYIVHTFASSAGVINPATLTVAANNQIKICGQPNPPMTASYSGFISGENINVLTSPASLSTTATINSAAGAYPITASGATAANYTINYTSGTLTVLPMLQLSCASVNVNGDNQFVVSWATTTNQNYQLECTTNLSAPNWAPLGGTIAGTGAETAVTNNMNGTPQCFFRVELQ